MHNTTTPDESSVTAVSRAVRTSALVKASPRIDAERGAHDFELQCLRILSCTARAMVSSPGGLRFKAGARPWLPGTRWSATE